MKKLILAAVAAAAICLGGCSTTGGISLAPADIASFEDQVIADAIAACKFEPTVASVGSLIAGVVVPGSAAITSVAAGLANSICAQAIAAAPIAGGKRMASAPIRVNGVLIEGHFVQ